MDDLVLLIDSFKRESEEMIDRLVQLVEAIGAISDEERNTAFVEALRIAHNFKGVAGTLGLESLAEFSHAFEDSLLKLQKSKAPVSEADVQRMLDGVAEIQRLSETGTSKEGLQSLIDVPADESDKTKTQVASDVPRQRSENIAPHSTPDEDKISEVSSSTIRVETSRMARLMSHAGESLITHNRMRDKHKELEQFQEEISALASQSEIDKDKLVRLAKVMQKITHRDQRDVEAFGHLCQNISDGVKLMRMTPLEDLAPFIRRTVRETARSLNKEVKLNLDLGTIELDRSLLDHLRDPFLHLIRNAIDHGIEATEARVNKGKPRRGKIQIQASMERSYARIEVSDDGRGLDAKAIGQSAVSRGLITEAQLGRMSHEEILALVFSNYFSTAQSVSQFSGRGVGLSVVKQEIEKAGGRAEIASRPILDGTTFYLTMPLNALSVDGLMVQANRQIYAIPIDEIDRIVKIPSSAVRNVDGSPVIASDDLDPTHVLWLSNLVGKGHTETQETMQVIILERGSRRMGLVVQEILGEREFVIEHLPWNMIRVPYVSGAIKMADGTVALSLDISVLFDAVSVARESPVFRPSMRPASGARVLVVDDSLTVRTLHRNILSSAGYDVSVCVNGKEAWQMLTNEPFDLLVSDIKMPQMDGVELTKKVRETDSLKHIPVILVTNFGESEDKEKGMAAGAAEYIVKGKYDHNQFLEAVNRLITK